MKLFTLPNQPDSHQFSDEQLSVLSHELRTPLAIISGYAQLLQEELEGNTAELVSPITESVFRLQSVIGSLLDYEAIDPDCEDHPSNCDPTVVIESLVQTFQSKAHKCGIELTCCAGSRQIAAYADTDLIESCVGRLLDNAIKFSSDGSVSVGVGGSSDRIIVEILDEGIGISGDPETLFSPFVQGSSGNNRTHEGLGLGLHLARIEATRMCGEIVLATRSDGGTKATLTFKRFARQSRHRAA